MEVITDYIRSLLGLFSDTANLSTVLLLVSVFILAYTVSTYSKSDLPGPFAFPLIGNTLNIVSVKQQSRHHYFRELQKKYGDIYRLYFGRKRVVFLNNYDLINEAFVKQADVFTYRPDFLPHRSGGIIWSNGLQWKGLRRFALRTMRDFGVGKKSLEEVIQQEVNGVLEQFKLTNGEAFSPRGVLSVAVSNVIHSIVFGLRYGHNDTCFQEVLDNFDKLFRLSGPLGLSNFYPILLFHKVNEMRRVSVKLLEYVNAQIDEHQKTYDTDHIRDFVDLYIKQEREETMDKDIFTQNNLFRAIIDLFAAGTETTTTTLLWALLYMIEYPDVQKKCQEEINKMIGSSRMIALSDKNNLPYVNATVQEVQRISSIVPLGLPHMTTQDCSLKGYHIPKNSVIMAQQSAVHMDPRNWEEPELFNPDRFIDESGNLIKSEKVIPFSTGPRVCMGESLARIELFLFFSNLLQRFNFMKNKDEEKLNFDGYFGVTVSPLPYKLRAVLR